MSEHTNNGDSVRGKLLIFVGKKVGKIQVFHGSKTHRKQRVKLNNGKCWIESPIDLPKGRS